MRQWLRERTRLQAKLTVSFGVLLTLALATSTLVFVVRSQDTISDLLSEQAKQISQSLAMAAEPDFRRGDRGEMKQLGTELLKSRNIVLVAFSDASGKVLELTSRDGQLTADQWQQIFPRQPGARHLMQATEREVASLGEFLQVTVPVMERSRHVFGDWLVEDPNPSTRLLGYITVGVSRSSELSQLNRITLLGVGVGGLILILSLPLVSGVVHRIFLPIRQLVTAADRISSGDYEVSVATDRPDEIGMLARAFNKMVQRIREHQQALHVANESLAEANRDLEEKVHQRTRELEQTNRRLQSEIAEKEDFLRAVSHDLNAPLRNISGMATMLLMKHREKFEDDVVHRLERIQKNVEMETDLIAELLELSRIKTRRQRLEEVDVSALLRDLGEVFEDDLKGRGITLSIEEGLPSLLCERARLRQVFQNLVDNAIKYMGDGPLKVIHISCRVNDEEAEFSVRDTGIGIDSEDLGKVFYVFRRGKNSAAMKVAGKGVGLASVKSIIETCSGRIWVESELGKGSTFRFTIPRKFVPALAAGARGQRSAVDAPPVRGAA